VENFLSNSLKGDVRALENSNYGTLVADDAGFKIVTPKGAEAELSWKDIEKIHAFKRDLLTTDLICLAFEKSGTEEWYEINEEMSGYNDLLEALQNHLSGFALVWVLDTTLPAFATNHKVIWERNDVAVG